MAAARRQQLFSIYLQKEKGGTDAPVPPAFPGFFQWLTRKARKFLPLVRPSFAWEWRRIPF